MNDSEYSISESGDEEGSSVLGKRLASIFLVDGSSSMFHGLQSSADKEDITDSPFVLALKSAQSILSNKILLPSSEHDLVGVVIFGNESDILIGRGSIRILVDLQEPEAEAILKIESVCKSESILTKLEAASASVSLANAFQICSAIFSEHVTEYDDCQILFFTNNDDPHHNSIDLQRKAKEAVTELHKANIDIHLFSLGKTFDLGAFYDDLLNVEGQSSTLTSAENEEDLTAKVCRQVCRQQPACKLDFTLGLNTKLKVGLYSFIRPVPMPKPFPLDRRTHQQIHSKVTKWAVSDCDAEPLASTNVIKVTKVGGEELAMTAEEIQQSKTAFGPRGLRLLGFKPIDQLDLQLSYRHASFAYPEDESVVAFRALLIRCQARKVAALCCLKSSSISKPHVVALIPQVEKEGDRGMEELSSGFHVLYLPYADHVRKLDYGELVAKRNARVPSSGFLGAEEKHITIARQVVNKLSMKTGYNPEIFQHPNLHVFWNRLEVKGLERSPQQDEFYDTTLPDRERIDKKISSLADSFNMTVFPDGADPSPMVAAQKLVADVEDAARCGRLEKLAVKTLKEYLTETGIAAAKINKLRKTDLIQMVEAQLAGSL